MPLDFLSTGPARLTGLLRHMVDWRPGVACVPRARCHHLSLNVRGVPPRYLISTVRLQLAQLVGAGRLGFACRARDEMASVWYWDEAALGAAEFGADAGPNGVQPWPEPLLRGPLDDGVHLIACVTGYEAVAVERGEPRRTRWFAVHPGEEAWRAFVRDAGLDPATHPCPSPARAPALTGRPKGWKLSTHMRRATSPLVWATTGAAAVIGAVLIAGLLHEYKLDALMAAERAEVARIARENATTIALQREITTETTLLAALRKALPAVAQLDLMKALAHSNLLNQETRVSLYEWEYRGGRLRLLFAVPDEEFSLGDFLAGIERIGIFKGVRLIPDSPNGTVGIQTVVAAGNTSGP